MHVVDRRTVHPCTMHGRQQIMNLKWSSAETFQPVIHVRSLTDISAALGRWGRRVVEI